MNWDQLTCRHGCDPERNPVTGLYLAPHGCICWPDHIQALCAQHAVKGQENNEMWILLRRPSVNERHN